MNLPSSVFPCEGSACPLAGDKLLSSVVTSAKNGPQIVINGRRGERSEAVNSCGMRPASRLFQLFLDIKRIVQSK